MGNYFTYLRGTHIYVKLAADPPGFTWEIKLKGIMSLE